jgi:hypothetical protein
MSKHKVNKHERPKAVTVARSNRARVVENAANREITRWEVAYARHPHVPALARQWSEQDAIAAAQRVVETCQRIRAHHTPAPTMAEVVESIRIAPPRPAPTGFIDPHTIRLAQRLSVALGLFAVFCAGLALGRAL